MATRTLLDSDALPAADAQTLSSHVQAADLPAAGAPAPAPQPDELHYEISVDDAGHQVTQRYTDATLPEGVRQLVAWVDNRPERSFTLER